MCNTMRTSILCAAFLGVFAVGCAGDLSGTGDDQQTPENCGNGTVDSGESCDDSNTASGDGCSSVCQTESTGGTPRIATTLDKTTVATQLGKTEMVTLTLMSVDKFAGDATITAQLVDATNVPITGAVITGPASVTLTEDGSAPAAFSIEIPSDFSGTDVAATLKIDVTSSAEPVAATATVNVAAVYTFEIVANTSNVINMHPATNKTITIRRGTKLRMVNGDTVGHISHGGGGIPHENQDAAVGGLPGATYEVNTQVIAPGMGKAFGCHTHGDATYAVVNLL
jgi:cysteine-rich repeat protein